MLEDRSLSRDIFSTHKQAMTGINVSISEQQHTYPSPNPVSITKQQRTYPSPNPTTVNWSQVREDGEVGAQLLRKSHWSDDCYQGN